MTTDKDINPKKLRLDFPMFNKPGKKPFVYLDSAASSQTCEPALKAMDAYYRKYRANVHRGMYPASAEATGRYEAARGKVAAMLGASADEVVFTRGATEGLNLLAQILSRKLRAGDEVVLTVMEHHSNLVPWQQLAKRRGFGLKFIGLMPNHQLDMEAAKRMITPATRVVSVMHVSNALGTVVPVKELAALAHAVGAVMIVDAAQSAGHRPIDVREIGCDFLAFSGHKMFGPTGIGAVWGRQALWQQLDPFLYGGDMILEVGFEDSVWNEMPFKFEAGTPNIAGAIGLGAAADYVMTVGPEVIARHERKIAEYAISRLEEVGRVRLFGPPRGVDRGGVVSFSVGDIHPHDLTSILAAQGVCVRGGHHCAMPLMRLLQVPGTTRASLSLYTTKEDIAALVVAVREAKRLFKL